MPGIQKIVAGLKKACEIIPKRSLEEVGQKAEGFLKIRTMNYNQDIPKFTLSNFDHTPDGDVFLYRGLNGVTKEMVEPIANLSNAASSNTKISEVLEKLGIKGKLSQRNREKAMNRCLQGEPSLINNVLFTAIDKGYAQGSYALGGGVLITYRMPAKKVEQFGFLGHSGDEVNFLFKVPQKYVHKVETIGNPEPPITFSQPTIRNNINNVITCPDLPPPPIETELSNPFLTIP